MERRSCSFLAKVFVGLILTAFAALAQTNTGRISGSVFDKSQAVISNATVVITDAERGTTRTLTTNEAGDYTAPNLLPGVYVIRATAAGFKSVERKGIELEVAKEIRFDFTLEPGDTQSTITVSEEAPLIDSSSAVLGGTLSNQTINDLPLNGRNFMGLLQLRPGVMAMPGGGKWSQSSNGLRPEYNVYILNGIDAIEGFSAQSALNAAGISGDTASLLPVDSIQEFNVQQNPKAEYGWKPGVVANIGLKSGTNTLHGTAYAFGRDGAWDARNPFIGPGVPKQETALEQFGATAGGAIKKDKLFYFLAYEGQTETIGAPATVSLPTTVAGLGTSTSLIDACQALPSGSRSALSLAMAGMDTNCNVVKPANNVFQSGTSAQFVPVIPMDVQSNNGLAKIDYVKNEKHNINGELFMNAFSGLATQNQVHDYWRTATENQARLGGIHYTWLPSATIVNEAKLGINRVRQVSGANDCGATGDHPDYSYLNVGAQSCGFPNITIQGFTALGCCSSFPKVQGPDWTTEFLDGLSWTKGNHAFKFGGEIRRMSFNGGTYSRGKGSFTFNKGTGTTTALMAFLSGQITQAINFVGNPLVNISDWGYAGYAQDDWRISKRVTINLGLRYEYVTPINEANNQLANFDPTLGMVQVGKQINQPYSGDKNNFAPRVGFAWDMFGNGKTVLRGGGALIYVLQGFNVLTSQQGTFNPTTGLNTTPTGALLNGVAGPGNINTGSVTYTSPSQINWALGGPIFSGGQITCTTAVPCPMLAVDPNLRTPYVLSWNLGIQRQLTNSLALDIGYIGNHGTKLAQLIDINAPALGSGYAPGATAATTALENQARPYYSKFPYISAINQLQNIDHSNYDGLQTTLTQRLSHGLNFTVGYTYSHSFDMSPGDWRGANVPSYNPNPNLDYASSNYDIRHRFTSTITYALPEKKGYAQMLEGWQVNTIVNISTSMPWSLIDNSSDLSGTGERTDRWNFYGSPSDFSNRGPVAVPYFAGTSNPTCLAQAQAQNSVSSLTKYGCYVSGSSMLLPPAFGSLGTMGQNIFRANGLHLVDFSITKKIKITERVSGQFRAEFFNVLNQTQYANPAYNSAGRANPTNGSSGTPFGNSPATPDVQIANPQIGTGAARSMQLGLKIQF
jgi:Carboxypeptidase regulatory-like domain/TonB dependent receptor